MDPKFQESIVIFCWRQQLIVAPLIILLGIECDLAMILGIQVANGSRLPLEKLPNPEYLSDDSSEDESEIGECGQTHRYWA